MSGIDMFGIRRRTIAAVISPQLCLLLSKYSCYVAGCDETAVVLTLISKDKSD
jgi:hypothetical protein